VRAYRSDHTFSRHLWCGTDIGSRRHTQETAELKKWYEAGGATAPTTDAGEGLPSSRTAGGKGSGMVATLKEIQPEELAAVGAAPEWFDVRVTLDKFTDTTQRDIWYKACPEPGCNKKVGGHSGGLGHTALRLAPCTFSCGESNAMCAA
jgi:hypothetical protein